MLTIEWGSHKCSDRAWYRLSGDFSDPQGGTSNIIGDWSSGRRRTCASRACNSLGCRTIFSSSERPKAISEFMRGGDAVAASRRKVAPLNEEGGLARVINIHLVCGRPSYDVHYILDGRKEHHFSLDSPRYEWNKPATTKVNTKSCDDW